MIVASARPVQTLMSDNRTRLLNGALSHSVVASSIVALAPWVGRGNNWRKDHMRRDRNASAERQPSDETGPSVPAAGVPAPLASVVVASIAASAVSVSTNRPAIRKLPRFVDMGSDMRYPVDEVHASVHTKKDLR